VSNGKLYKDFFYPPFSVLDAKQGWWQNRKRQWLDLGIKSELGRDDTWESLKSIYSVKASHIKNSVHKQPPAWATNSVFDPVLCEIFYRWFVPRGGLIFDAFAGGSVRGIVASRIGFKYMGFDIRQEQVEANEIQAKDLCSDPMPKWRCLDSCGKSIHRHFKGQADFLFSCPPYGDLEVYSDLPGDISNMPWDVFAGSLRHSIKQQAKRLKDNRFAAYVVSDIRGKDGSYLGLPEVVRSSFCEAGLKYYGEIVLLNALGTLPLRVRQQWEKSRKPGRAHQNVLLFVKGDPKLAKQDLGDMPCNDPF